jgi:hypothetical protein
MKTDCKANGGRRRGGWKCDPRRTDRGGSQGDHNRGGEARAGNRMIAEDAAAERLRLVRERRRLGESVVRVRDGTI